MISNEKIVKLLEVAVDNKFSFEPCLNSLCKKVTQKLLILARVSRFIFFKKAKSYHEGIFHVTIQLLSFGMDVS